MSWIVIAAFGIAVFVALTALVLEISDYLERARHHEEQR